MSRKTDEMKRTFACLALVLLSVMACRKVIEKPSWNTQVLAPLVKTQVIISDIIADTVYKENADHSISIVEKREMLTVGIDSLVGLKVDPWYKSAKLTSLKLDPQVVVKKITVADLGRQLQKDSDPTTQQLGLVMEKGQGLVVDVPAFGNINAGPFDFDLSEYLESADLKTGTLQLKIINGLPLNISKVNFALASQGSAVPLVDKTLYNLAPQSTTIDSSDLAGKRVKGILEATINDMAVDAKKSVKIDTNNALIVEISLKNVTVSEATAVFPGQDVIKDTSRIYLLNMGDVQLTQARLRKGTVKIVAYSTASDTIYFNYNIPSATLNGVPFSTTQKIRPRTGTSPDIFSFDFSGYDLNLSGKNNDTVNTLYNTVLGSIKYSGELRTFSLQDSVFVIITIEDIDPDYAKGYLGSDTISVGPGTASLDIFDRIESGTLELEKIKLLLVLENGLGIKGAIRINDITAYNSKRGTTKKLVNPSVIGVSHTIAAASDIAATRKVIPVTDTIDISTGSNITDLLSILPDKILYDGEVAYNLSGNAGGYGDFVYRGANFKPSLFMEMPLSMIASSLTLADTVDFNGKQQESAIRKGDFTVHVDNGFPLEGDLYLCFLDASGKVLDTIPAPGAIKAAPLTAGRVSAKVHSTIPFHLDEARLNRILLSQKLVFRVKFSSRSSAPGEYVKIYSDYTTDFKLVGDFEFKVD